jgi:hypothetical protein
VQVTLGLLALADVDAVHDRVRPRLPTTPPPRRETAFIRDGWRDSDLLRELADH